MNLIGIDPASHTGVVVMDYDGGLLLSERVRIRDGDRWVADAHVWARRLELYTETPHSTLGGAIAIIEAQHLSHVSGAGAGVLIPAQVAGWWVAVCQIAGVDVTVVQPATWQSWAGIKRRSAAQPLDTKRQARALACARFGASVDRPDVADAALLADWARHQEQLVTAWQAA